MPGHVRRDHAVDQSCRGRANFLRREPAIGPIPSVHPGNDPGDRETGKLNILDIEFTLLDAAIVQRDD